MVTAGRELHAIGDLVKKGSAFVVGGGDFFQQGAVGFGIYADYLVGEPKAFCLVCCCDLGRNLRTAFGWLREREVGGTYGRDVQVQIDPVERRSGNFGLIVEAATRCART